MKTPTHTRVSQYAQVRVRAVWPHACALGERPLAKKDRVSVVAQFRERGAS